MGSNDPLFDFLAKPMDQFLSFDQPLDDFLDDLIVLAELEEEDE